MMSALEELQELCNAEPDTERISLRAKQLERVDAEMAFIQLHFANVRHLDLSENALETLPADFGQLLPKLVALDLTKNRLRSVADLGEVLQQCASLKSLSVSLKSATEEKLLLVMLPKLRILNGVPLSGPSSPPPPPPPTSSSIPESPVKPGQALSTALLSPSTASNSSTGGDRDFATSHPDPSSSSPTAQPPPPPPLHGRISSPQDKRTLRLQFANLKVERQAAEYERQRDGGGAAEVPALVRKQRRSAAGPAFGAAGARTKSSSVRPTETPASISDDNTDWRKLLKSQTGGRLRTHASASASTLQGIAVNDDNKVSTTASFLTDLKTVVKAFHQCDTKASANGGTQQQLMVYEQLDRHVDLLAAQLSRQEKEALPTTDDANEIARLRSSIAMLQTRWNLLEVCGVYGVEKANGIDGELGNAFARLLQLQKQVLKALQLQQAAIAANVQHLVASEERSPARDHEQQMKMLLEVAESLESDLDAAQTRLQQEKAQRELLEQENWSLKRENDAFKRKSPLTSSSTGETAAATPATAGSAAAAARRPGLSGMDRSLDAPRQRIRRRTEAQRRSRSKSPDRADAAAATTTTPAPARIRNLTLKQVVDLVHCITASKLRSDTRALEIAGAGAPRETMEQHMYAYLNQRFGLHVLVVDYASALWKGCAAFARQANDAAVFLALLRNQLDEGFLAVKKQLKQALVDLLRAYFQAKHPLKQEIAIATLVQNRLQHRIFEDEWRELLTYLYDAQDVRASLCSVCVKVFARKDLT